MSSCGNNYLTDVYAVKKSNPMIGFPLVVLKGLILKKNMSIKSRLVKRPFRL